MQVEVDAVLGQRLAHGVQQGAGLGRRAAEDLRALFLSGLAGEALGQPLVEALAHALDQVLQHAHLEGQLLRAAHRLVLHGVGQDRQAFVDLLELAGDVQVRLFQGVEVALHGLLVDRSADHALEREGQAQAGREARGGRHPAAADPPEQQGDRHGQAD